MEDDLCPYCAAFGIVARRTDHLSRAQPMLSSQIDPCPACGRSRKDWLLWQEAYDLQGQARADCLTCLLTIIPRPQSPPSPRPACSGPDVGAAGPSGPSPGRAE